MPGGESFIGQVLLTVRSMHEAKMDAGEKALEVIRSTLGVWGELPEKRHESLLRFIISSLEETEGDGRRMAARYNPAPQPKKQQYQTKKPGRSCAPVVTVRTKIFAVLEACLF